MLIPILGDGSFAIYKERNQAMVECSISMQVMVGEGSGVLNRINRILILFSFSFLGRH